MFAQQRKLLPEQQAAQLFVLSTYMRSVYLLTTTILVLYRAMCICD